MSVLQLLRLVSRYFWLMFLIGSLMGGLVFWLTLDEERTYTSSALVNTGIFSGYNLESKGNNRLDYHQASAELDNLLNLATSFETHEELAQRLLTECLLLTAPNRTLISPRAFAQLHAAIPDSIVQRIRVDGDTAATLANVRRYCQRGDDNPVYTLLYASTSSIWSINHFRDIKIETEGKSDMLRETYTTTDPGLCRRTLALHIEIYAQKQLAYKRAQGQDVVEYFQAQLAESRRALRQGEDDLTDYMRGNKIINYYEQTRFIAAKREDLLELEFREFMQLQSADSTRKALEAQMAQRVSLGQVNRQLGSLRDSLAAVSAQLARLEWLSPADSTPRQSSSPRLARLQQEAERLKGRMLTTGDSLFHLQVTPRGTELDQLLFQWLRTMMLEAEARAKLSVVDIRKQAFDSIYQKMAPVGSEIKRMERTNYVHEQAYLENLHSLNLAVMHQQNMLLASTLNLVSRPFFPSRPDPSNRKFLVVAAFLAGVVLTLGLVIALAYFDNSLQSPDNAAEVIGLEVVGALPRLPTSPMQHDAAPEAAKPQRAKASQVDYAYLAERSLGLLWQHVQLDLKQRNVQRRPVRVLLISMRRQEGKSALAAMLAQRLRQDGERVRLLLPAISSATAEATPPAAPTKGRAKDTAPWTVPPHADTHRYALPPRFYDLAAEEDLLPPTEQADAAVDYLFTELPPLLLHPYPVRLISQADVVLLVCRANRVWRSADVHTLLKVQAATEQPIQVVLNGCAVDHLESMLGFIPKKRTLLRRLAKQVFTRSFQAEDSR